jgi:hypothetical protein
MASSGPQSLEERQTMKPILFAAAMLCAVQAPAMAEEKAMDHTGGMDHGAAMDVAQLPTEPGQSAFAAIQEVVVILEADPATDWSKVNVEALRQHLIDMSNVTLGAKVESSPSADGVKFTVSGEGPVRDSIQRMVKAHAETMQGADGWGFAAEPTDTGASLVVTPPDKAAAGRLAGLSFIGIMTRGMHHQRHHLMIAKGLGPHD